MGRFVATAKLQVNTWLVFSSQSVDIVSKVFTYDVNEISLDKKQCSIVVSLLSLNSSTEQKMTHFHAMYNQFKRTVTSVKLLGYNTKTKI